MDVDLWLPGYVHASRLRCCRNGSDSRQKCKSHHDDEFHGVWIRTVCFLGVRIRDPDGWSWSVRDTWWRRRHEWRIQHQFVWKGVWIMGHARLLHVARRRL